jgi:hypothetical protein
MIAIQERLRRSSGGGMRQRCRSKTRKIPVKNHDNFTAELAGSFPDWGRESW